MNHKDFFVDYGGWFVTGTPFTFDDLYEAFKQRLIEELRVDLKSESCVARLADITSERSEE